MLLKQLVQQPITSSQLLVCDPFRMTGKEELVKEVIGLANADVEGPRYILFGVNPGAMEGSKLVGIDENTAADLKKAHRYLSELIEPVVGLAFVFDTFNGKLVGALEISECDAGPFVVGQDYSRELTRGMCWKRDGRELYEVDIADLARETQPEPTEVIDEAELIDPLATPIVEVGFNDDVESKFLRLPIPDASNPPFSEERQESKNLRQTIRDKVNTVTTQILKLAKLGTRDDDPNSSTDVVKAAEELFGEAENHYYFEERAVQLNFAICNKGTQAVRDIRIEFGFPNIEGFDIADRIYASPFDKRSQAEARSRSYPNVEQRGKAIFVRSTIRALEPGVTTQALDCALRLAVKPNMQNKKVAILYTLRRQDQNIGQGRLKVQFGQVVA